MQLSDLCLVVKSLVPPDQCERFQKEFERRRIACRRERSTNAITGINSLSNYQVIELAPNTKLYIEAADYMNRALNLWLKYLDNFQAFHYQYLKHNLKFPHAVRLLKYSKGQSIHPHVDWDYFTHASVTLNLNSGYRGGEFSFFNGKHVVELGEGDALIFPADCFWVHEVKTITEGSRYSINSFVKSCPQDQINELKKYIDHNNLEKSRLFKFSTNVSANSSTESI